MPLSTMMAAWAVMMIDGSAHYQSKRPSILIRQLPANRFDAECAEDQIGSHAPSRSIIKSSRPTRVIQIGPPAPLHKQ
jgi:hypothetical protein